MPEDASPDDVRIRKVKVLGDRARAQALQQGLGDNDLVLVRTVIGSLPEYKITKIEGSPIQFLQDKYLQD
ncbi:MAG: hypothetical protein HZB92_01470 [Euryarchaeota archaeon]|nr:hypothetical protein [Euryarchaeota archaeon]